MRKHALLIGATLLVCALLLTPVALAQSSANFDLRWHLIAGGGGRSSSPDFVVNGSVGQPSAGALTSAHYRLGAGFWYGLGQAAPPPPTPGPYMLYLPIVLKESSGLLPTPTQTYISTSTPTPIMPTNTRTITRTPTHVPTSTTTPTRTGTPTAVFTSTVRTSTPTATPTRRGRPTATPTRRGRPTAIFTTTVGIPVEVAISTESGQQLRPAVACNTRRAEYLVVWQGNADVCAQRVSSCGQRQGGKIAVSTAAERQEHPVAA